MVWRGIARVEFKGSCRLETLITKPLQRLDACSPRKGRRYGKQETPMRAPWGDIAPHLAEISDAVLFDDV